MKQILVALSIVLLPTVALAEAPFQFTAPGVRAPDDPRVNGFRLSFLHGKAESLRGIDFGLASLSETGDFSGFGAVMGILRITGNMSGCASGLVNVHSGTDSGVNAAFINHINTLENGANIGFLNIADGYTKVDLGGLNVSKSSSVQLGFVNVTSKITSFQLGFLNIAENGFFPVFPIVNFPKQ